MAFFSGFAAVLGREFMLDFFVREFFAEFALELKVAFFVLVKFEREFLFKLVDCRGSLREPRNDGVAAEFTLEFLLKFTLEFVLDFLEREFLLEFVLVFFVLEFTREFFAEFTLLLDFIKF